MYTKIIAFFMTGTGNSYKVANWFLASVDKVKTELYQVREKPADFRIGENNLLVFSYPTHGFTAPWLMMKHIFRLPKGNGTHVVLLPTRAGTRILGLSLPGMEGTAGYLIALLLLLRGYKVKGVAAVDMPSNWTAVHWGLTDENVRVISAKGEAKVTRIANTVLSGHSFYSGFIPLILGILLARISFMYLIIAQLVLSKLFFASNTCNGCRLCQKICPKQSIKMLGNKPHWTYSCDSCMACMNYCPQKAIQVSPLTVFLFSYVLSFPVTTWITGKIGYVLMTNPPGIIQFAVQYLYTLISVALVCWILHHVLRIKPVAALLAGLSHTKYFRRYKAPGVSLNDIHK
ncbi:EFR1 family ferrodoxin [Sporomusa malonica]|uniref:4Fe-4S dicluster domain-containing protein n=1 Tax=Sporomusa malonica TaxID=112901 RepID=A0A1W1YFP7_9FIRM|nr:4Fe-4S dicluster domain-containing protein [Sporomusa malonica]